MRVAFIHPPYIPKIFSENLRFVDEYFCLGPPIILAYAAAVAQQAGHETIIIDAHALKLSAAQVIAQLQAWKPDILCFRAESYHFHDALFFMKTLKKTLHIPIIAGGINLWYYPLETMTHTCIDYGIRGDAQPALPLLLHAIEHHQPLHDIRGVCYRDNSTVIISPDIPITHIADLPFPARQFLPHERYHSFISQRSYYTVLLTTRGCPYQCRFCAIPYFPYQIRPAQHVLEEMTECYTTYDIREFDIFDATFFYNKDRDADICRAIIRSNMDIAWSCRTRIDQLDLSLLKLAKQAGCRQIYLGIETACQTHLDAINKNIHVHAVQQAIDLCKKTGIKTLGFFMIGVPGETRESARATIRAARKLGLDFAQFCRVIQKPFSALHQEQAQQTGIDPWKAYLLGKTQEKPFPNPWTSFSAQEIQLLLIKAYCSFYLRPFYIIKKICACRSMHALKRYTRAGLSLVVDAFRHKFIIRIL